jgi:hypothetical protein
MTTPHDAIEAAAEEYANERTKFTSHWMEKMNQHGEASRHFKAGWTACQSHMLTQASEGFDEWFVATYRYHYNELVIPESVRPQKDAWQAAKLSAMKELEEMKADLKWALTGVEQYLENHPAGEYLSPWAKHIKEIRTRWGIE